MVILAPRFAAQLCPYDLARHKSSLHMHSCMLVWHLSSESSPAIQSSNPVQWSSPQSSPAIRDSPFVSPMHALQVKPCTLYIPHILPYHRKSSACDMYKKVLMSHVGRKRRWDLIWDCLHRMCWGSSPMHGQMKRERYDKQSIVYRVAPARLSVACSL